MEFGSQRLYGDAREGGFQDLGPPPDQFQFDIPELPPDDSSNEEGLTVPPTLDKIINGKDTAPLGDEWLVPETPNIPPPDKKPTRRERRKQVRATKKRTVGKTRNNRETAAISAELVGIAALSAGFWQIRPFLGLICLGLCLILVGVAISRDSGAA